MKLKQPDFRRGDFRVLRIEPDGIELVLCQTLTLPKSAHLGWVPAVIHVAMGWTRLAPG